MSRNSNRISDYFLASAQDGGAALFPSGLFMYDLPSLRRTASRTLNNVELTSEQISSSRKQSPSPVPSSSSSPSSIADDDDEQQKKILTTSEDWWRQAMEPITTTTNLPVSHSSFSMIDDDGTSNDNNVLLSLVPRLNSAHRIVVHNQPLSTLTETYSNKAADYVAQWYERRSMPSLLGLIKHGFLKINKEQSIRLSISNKKKEIFGQLDKNGKISIPSDNRLFDTVESFYHAYGPSRRKQNEKLNVIYERVCWYEKSMHSILLDYAETLVKVSGMKTRLVNDDELLSRTNTMKQAWQSNMFPKEILVQINCWTEGCNEIEFG